MVARAKRKSCSDSDLLSCDGKEKAPRGAPAKGLPAKLCPTGLTLDSQTTYGIWYANAPVLARRVPADQPAWPTS
jgi:hypothetical protein